MEDAADAMGLAPAAPTAAPVAGLKAKAPKKERTPADRAEETKKRGARRVTARAKKAQLVADAAAKATAELAMALQANANTQLYTSTADAQAVHIIKQ
jgi:hypothetical protein